MSDAEQDILVPVREVLADVTPDATTHAYVWYYEFDGTPMFMSVWPVGCTREEALGKRPQKYGSAVVRAALLRVPLDRAWLRDI